MCSVALVDYHIREIIALVHLQDYVIAGQLFGMIELEMMEYVTGVVVERDVILTKLQE